LRILTQNVNTYNVGTNDDGVYRNGHKKVKHSIFFNFIQGYRELISFKTKESADILCNVIDALIEDRLKITIQDDNYYVVFDKTTGYNIVILNVNDVIDKVIFYHEDINEHIIDVNALVTLFGLEDEVV